MEQDLIVRRVSKLSKLKDLYGKVYWQEHKRYDEEGEPIENFSGGTQGLIGAKMNLTPHWNKNQGQWAFYGTLTDLINLAKRLNLTDKDGKPVMPNEYSLTSRRDPFFGHMEIWNKVIMEDTTHSLNSSDPFLELYMRILKGREDINDPGSDVQKSAFDTEGSNLEIVSTKAYNNKEVVKIDEEVEAIVHFKKLENNFDKLKRVMAIVNPPGYNDSYNDPTALKVLLKTSVIDDDNPSKRYWGMSPRKFFIMICNLDQAELEVYSNVYQAKNLGIIRLSDSMGATIIGVPIANGSIKTEKSLVNYYLDPDHFEGYQRLLDNIALKDQKKELPKTDEQLGYIKKASYFDSVSEDTTAPDTSFVKEAEVKKAGKSELLEAVVVKKKAGRPPKKKV